MDAHRLSISSPPPASIPNYVYRVHRASAQTKYSFAEGFHSKNKTTIINTHLTLRQFSLAHLTGATNIASPYISVYDNQAHAERIALYFSQVYGEETLLVKIDTRHFPRGPVFRAADCLAGDGENELLDPMRAALHQGEYMVMYRIPPQAIIMETPVGRGCGAGEKWRAVGAVGERVGVKP